MKPEGKQLEFIECVIKGNSYILVEAPAGTGKTFCCIQAAKAFNDAGYFERHQKALVLTFSRNARAQILMELSKVENSNSIYKHIEVNNYHSFFKKYLDSYRDIIGIKQPLCILDDDDYLDGLFDFANKKNIPFMQFNNTNIFDDFDIVNEKLIKVNHKAKVNKITDKQIFEIILTSDLYTKETGSVCFAQFGRLLCKVISRSSEIVDSVSQDYPLLILDEYQDTNYFQEKFVREILKKSKGIFFADSMQMIYEFRGSTIQRIDDLDRLYNSLKKICFTEYYRYKNKQDIVNILNSIRIHQIVDYTNLVNGKLININAPCKEGWAFMKKENTKKAQCTILCSNIFYGLTGEISLLIKNNKSIALLSHSNDIVDGLIKVFQEKNYYPRAISDTKEMMQLNRLLKKLTIQNNIEVSIGKILSIVALCISKQQIENETIDTLLNLSWLQLSRKRRPVLKLIYEQLSGVSQLICWDDKKLVIQTILKILIENGYNINFVRRRYLEQCLEYEELTPDVADRIMLQRQYINSFSNIGSGLYITTIHQSKGREFDCVFVIDIENVKKDKNLLYVSNSRMKERLYPVAINYQGSKYF